MMKIDLSKTKDLLGESFPFECSEAFSEFEYSGMSYNFLEPVSVNGAYLPEEDGVMVTAEVKTVLSALCARCLNDARVNISLSLSETFSGSGEDDVYEYTGDVLVLDRAVLDNIILNIPLHVLCKEDCKGLCPHCGKDLNLETCDCEIETKKANSPFAALDGLFRD